MKTKDHPSELKPIPPKPANKVDAGVQSPADKPCASPPCLLDSDEEFNPDYLPDYSKGNK